MPAAPPLTPRSCDNQNCLQVLPGEQNYPQLRTTALATKGKILHREVLSVRLDSFKLFLTQVRNLFGDVREEGFSAQHDTYNSMCNILLCLDR